MEPTRYGCKPTGGFTPGGFHLDNIDGPYGINLNQAYKVVNLKYYIFYHRPQGTFSWILGLNLRFIILAKVYLNFHANLQICHHLETMVQIIVLWSLNQVFAEIWILFTLGVWEAQKIGGAKNSLVWFTSFCDSDSSIKVLGPIWRYLCQVKKSSSDIFKLSKSSIALQHCSV